MNHILSWLRMTDWHMNTPAPYSFFHISVSVIGVAAAALFALRLSRSTAETAHPHTANDAETAQPRAANGAETAQPRAANGAKTAQPRAANGAETAQPHATNGAKTAQPRAAGNAAAADFSAADSAASDSRKICRSLFICGLLLAAGELYKQLFLYYVIFGSYNWWYFPFQLCSIPMYLCLLLPLLSRNERIFRTVCTFLQDFGLLGGIMALAEPSGLLHPYWTLTLHGLIWHILLVFIGLLLAFSRIPDRTAAGFLLTLPMLAVFCVIATVINVATGGAADMFYISPYYPVTQVVFYQISLRFGTGAGICVYVLCLCAGGFLCHLLAGFLNKRRG